MKNLIPLLFAGLVGGGVAVGGVYLLTRNNKTNFPTETAFVKQVNSVSYEGSMPFDFTEAAERSMSAVVHIRTSESEKQVQNRKSQNPFGNQNPFGSLFGEEFFSGFGQRGPQQGFGSGVIISEDGYIVTNNHVVDFGEEVKVTLYDNREFVAKVVGTDKTTDIAVLKVDAKNLTPIRYGDSDKAKVGQWVLAVGNPRNLTSTVTAGIISAKGRDIHINRNTTGSIESFIQTDAAVNPGNSGGALVDAQGNLIGINTAIASETGSYEGYSFAIPVNLMTRVVDDLIKTGKSQRGYLGVNYVDIDAELARDEKLNVTRGVFVQDVQNGGAAQYAGLLPGDVITQVNGQDIKNGAELKEKIGSAKVGETVSLTVNRDGAVKKIAVQLKDASSVATRKERSYQRQ